MWQNILSLFLKTIQMLALSLLQEHYCPVTFFTLFLIPVYKHCWTIPRLRKISEILLGTKISSGNLCCCCPLPEAPNQVWAWLGHQLLPSVWACPSHLHSSIFVPRARSYYFDSTSLANLYPFNLMPGICFTETTFSHWYLCPDRFIRPNSRLNSVSLLPR